MTESSTHWDAATEIEESDDPEAAFAAVPETAHEFGDLAIIPLGDERRKYSPPPVWVDGAFYTSDGDLDDLARPDALGHGELDHGARRRLNLDDRARGRALRHGDGQ